MAGSSTKAKPAKANLFSVILRFIRQVVSELKKVVYPTRQELTTFAIVVLVFVVIFMIFLGVVDFGAGWAVMQVFG